MSSENLVRAAAGTAIQVLGVDESSNVLGTVSGTTVRVTLPTGAEIVEVNLNGPAHVQFGDSSVTAATTDRFLPAGSYFYKVHDYTHIAAIQDAGATATIISVTTAL